MAPFPLGAPRGDQGALVPLLFISDPGYPQKQNPTGSHASIHNCLEEDAVFKAICPGVALGVVYGNISCPLYLPPPNN